MHQLVCQFAGFPATIKGQLNNVRMFLGNFAEAYLLQTRRCGDTVAKKNYVEIHTAALLIIVMIKAATTTTAAIPTASRGQG